MIHSTAVGEERFAHCLFRIPVRKRRALYLPVRKRHDRLEVGEHS